MGQHRGAITVVTATLGKQCGGFIGNHTDWVAEECNGKLECSFLVKNRGGEPYPHCAKAFETLYRCGEETKLRRVEHDDDDGKSYPIELGCP